MTRQVLALATTVALACVLAFGAGCGPFGESEDDKAKDAAAAYMEDLQAFADDLAGATRQQFADKEKDQKPGSNEKGKKDKAEEDKPTPIEVALEDAPVLEKHESGEASYADAQAVSERLAPMLSELDLIASEDQTKEYLFSNKLYGTALRFADEVLARSTDFFYPKDDKYIFGGPKVLYDFSKTGIERELPPWRDYRKRVAAVEPHSPLQQSMLDCELAQIDQEIDFFTHYIDRLKSHEPEEAELAYYDELWPDESPLRLLPAGAFGSGGDPYFKLLGGGEPVARELVDGVGQLAADRSVGADSPSVGDGYRAAILAGFLSPLEKSRKYEGYIVDYQAWMLYRIRELEHTPDEAFQQALTSINLQLVKSNDTRNYYTELLSALGALSDDYPVTKSDTMKLSTYLREMPEELGVTYPPILEPTRDRFLEALAGIDLKTLADNFVPNSASFDAFSDSLDARDKSQRQYEEASKKVKSVMQDGAKAIDSPKKLRKAIREAVLATSPSSVQG